MRGACIFDNISLRYNWHVLTKVSTHSCILSEHATASHIQSYKNNRFINYGRTSKKYNKVIMGTKTKTGLLYSILIV